MDRVIAVPPRRVPRPAAFLLRTIRTLLCFLPGSFAVAVAAPPSAVHPPPRASAELVIEDDSVALRVTAWTEQWQEWLGRPVVLEEAKTEGGRSALAADFARFVERGELLAVDGLGVVPVPGPVATPEEIEASHGYPILAVTAKVALASKPRNVTVRWKDFRGLEENDRAQIVVILETAGVLKPVPLRPQEPEYTWHSGDFAPRPVHPVEAVGAPSSRELPLPSLGLAALGLCALVLPRRLALRRRAVLATVLFVTAGALWTVRTASPFGPAEVEVPPPGPSLEVFRTLLENVYRSFDGESEDEIYDTLATSVAPELLDSLYADVYASLVLREEGGAVCHVDHTEILECKRLEGSQTEAEATDGPAFWIDASWRVVGQVLHFGHLHERSNRYRAVFRVRHDGRSWKIARQVPLESMVESTRTR